MKFKIALAIAALTFASGSTAQVNNEMTRMFNQRGNATAPGFVQGSSRGVITGGSLTLKNPIVSTAGWQPQFQPPSIQAGCGGIDIQGGYLTLPSADAFVDVARAVAANAQGYAFKLALSAICDSCEDKMTQIQDLVARFGAESRNSCEIAQTFMDNTGISQGITNAAERLGASMNLNSGNARDNAEAATQPGEESAIQRAYADNPEAVNRELLGNVVWDALKENDIAQILGATGSKTFREEIMTLTGSVIACLPGENGCPGEAEDGAEPITRPIMPKIRLKDLVYASRGQANNVTVYRCNDDACLAPNPTESDIGETVTDRILDAFLGKDGEPGLISYRRQDPTKTDITLTAEQRAAEAMAGQVGAYALQLAGSSTGNEELARRFITLYAEAAAAQFIVSTVQPILQAAGTALAADIRPSAADASKQLVEVERVLQEDYNTMMGQLQSMSAISQEFEALMRNAPQHMALVGGTGYVPTEGR